MRFVVSFGLAGLLSLSGCGGQHAPPLTPKQPSSGGDQSPTSNHEPSSGGNQPRPSQPTAPQKATFATLKSQIFQKSCYTCHVTGSSGANVPLQTREDLINSPLDLVLPGDPDDSGLVIAVSRSDAKRMPLASAGFAALSADEVALIRQWIQEGAKE